MDDVIAKEKVVLNDVPDEPPRNACRCQRGSAPKYRPARLSRKPRIDVDDGRAALFRFHHPAKSDRVRFGHGGAFDQNAIGVSEILLRSRSSAPAE